jgi:hypothetical protein
LAWARLIPKIEMAMFAPIRIMAKIARYQAIMSTYDKARLRQKNSRYVPNQADQGDDNPTRGLPGGLIASQETLFLAS